MKRFLVLSLLVHAVLLGFLLRARMRSVSSAPEPVMVELGAEPVPANAPPVSASSKPTVASAKASAVPRFALFAPVHKPDLRAVRPGEVALGAGTRDELSPFNASEDVLKSAPASETGALAWVYRKAQYSIGYPQPFIKHDITGVASARLVFGSDGKLKHDLLSVRADSPYLRVYVYRVLEATFGAEPVPLSLVKWKDTLEVFCYVSFSFTEPMKVALASPTPIVGNKVYLARSTPKSVAEKLRWNLGPIHGLFPVPVVGVDMLWFARKYDEHKHPLRAAAEADDLAPWRKDPLFYD
jgi:hypothetical protein